MFWYMSIGHSGNHNVQTFKFGGLGDVRCLNEDNVFCLILVWSTFFCQDNCQEECATRVSSICALQHVIEDVLDALLTIDLTEWVWLCFHVVLPVPVGSAVVWNSGPPSPSNDLRILKNSLLGGLGYVSLSNRMGCWSPYLSFRNFTRSGGRTTSVNIWCSLMFFDPKVSCEIPGDSHFEKHGSKVEGKCPPVSPCCAVDEASSQLRAAATAKQGGPATTAAVMKPQRCQVVTVCTS